MSPARCTTWRRTKEGGAPTGAGNRGAAGCCGTWTVVPLRLPGHRRRAPRSRSSTMPSASSVSSAFAARHLSLVATRVPLPPTFWDARRRRCARESSRRSGRHRSSTIEANVYLLLEAIVGGVAASGKRSEKGSWTSLIDTGRAGGAGPGSRRSTHFTAILFRGPSVGRRAARRADVGGIERLVAGVLKTDDRLGRWRPQMTAALLRRSTDYLIGRRLRLARDAWPFGAMGSRLPRRIRPAIDGCVVVARPGADCSAVWS